jgi:hypothetical protein
MMSKPDTRRDRPALLLLLAYATMTSLILINDSLSSIPWLWYRCMSPLRVLQSCFYYSADGH